MIRERQLIKAAYTFPYNWRWHEWEKVFRIILVKKVYRKRKKR